MDVCFSNKSTGTFDFVIIADGIHSKTRELIDSAYSADYDQANYGAQYLGTQIWRTIIPTPPKLNNPFYMLGTDKVFLLYPINGAKTYVYAHHVRDRKGKDPDPENHIATVRDLFQEFDARAPEALEAIQNLTPPVMSHYLETSRDVMWSQGPRGLFAGDASRGFSPMLQNGAAQAFEDAYVLGELFKSRDNPETLAARYQERRGNRAAWVKQTSDTRIAALSEEKMTLRDAAIREKGAPNVSAFRILMQHNP